MSNNEATFTDAEKTAMKYLFREVEWAQRAGRILIGFMLGAVLSLSLVLSQPNLDQILRSVFGAILLAIGIIAWFWFLYYFHRQATQKSHLQSIIKSRLNGEVLEHFEKATRAEKQD